MLQESSASLLAAEVGDSESFLSGAEGEASSFGGGTAAIGECTPAERVAFAVCIFIWKGLHSNCQLLGTLDTLYMFVVLG